MFPLSLDTDGPCAYGSEPLVARRVAIRAVERRVSAQTQRAIHWDAREREWRTGVASGRIASERMRPAERKTPFDRSRVGLRGSGTERRGNTGRCSHTGTLTHTDTSSRAAIGRRVIEGESLIESTEMNRGVVSEPYTLSLLKKEIKENKGNKRNRKESKETNE